MDKSDILPNYSKILTTQEYTGDTVIDGVKFLPLSYHRDDTGEFVELGRFVNGQLKTSGWREREPRRAPAATSEDVGRGAAKRQDPLPFYIAQISTSLLLPGAIKAFHLHFDQTDIWYVSPHQRLLIGLLDTRKSSPTNDKTMRFILGAGVAQLLIIPPGVAHGAANPWQEPTTLTYFTDCEFNPGHPDEHRLPFDLFGPNFWKLNNG